jgi:hypothetical protein
MEVCILEQLGWSIVPGSGCTTSGLLFMTGLLEGLPRDCTLLLHTAILNSYRPIPMEDTESLPDVERYVTLYQARDMDPVCTALACYHVALVNCTTRDLLLAAQAFARVSKSLSLSLLLEGKEAFTRLSRKPGSNENEWEEEEEGYDAQWVSQIIDSMLSCVRERLEKLVYECCVDTRGLLHIARSLDGEFYFDILHFLDEMISCSI